MILREYRSEDCAGMARLFYETVHTVNARDYTPEQLDAWATGEVDLEQWDRSFKKNRTIVAEMEGILAGFGDMDGNGYLDRLYVHKDFQGRGIGRAICDALEGGAEAAFFTTHASITARGFFEKRGYRMLREQQVERRGVWLTNFVMEKKAGEKGGFRTKKSGDDKREIL